VPARRDRNGGDDRVLTARPAGAGSRDPARLTPPPDWPSSPHLTAGELRRAFDVVDPLTIGIEEELFLVHRETLDLAPESRQALAVLDGDPRFVDELRLSQLELVTPVCATAGDAARELADARATLCGALPPRLALAAAGTHPFSTNWGDITEGDRYRLIADEYTWAAQRSLACGLHVHVAVGHADRTLAVFNALRSYLPELGALAANSPFYEGRDTGLCSIRPKLNEAFPRSGIPPSFSSWKELAGYLDWARKGSLFPDPTHFWWDLRPHMRFGTLELRVADTQTSVADAAAIAAVFHSLVAMLSDRYDAGGELPVHETYRIVENGWRALRHGVRGWLVDLETGVPQETRERISALLEELRPHAARLRCSDELLHARALLVGNGADRQRYVADRDGLQGLVRWLVEETERPAADVST
jgi:carboxylate-amine ligase